MSEYSIQNSNLTIKINTLGAELTSLKDTAAGTEYLWNADPAYWRRHAPILFPIVGSLKGKSYTYQEKNYTLPQHGFARDLEFKLISHTDTELWFSLDANEETKKVYPFPFRLELGYHLEERKVTVFWRVLNKGTEEMHFSIGGHPAFYCPLKPDQKQSDCYFEFDTKQPIRYLLVNDQGLEVKLPEKEQYVLNSNDGIVQIATHMFDKDALIIEGHQCHQVSLLDPDKKPYLKVTFDAPLFGLWSPSGKQAPFVCIEPWYGRCDSSEFSGTLEERDYSNSLQAGATFEKSYTIEVL